MFVITVEFEVQQGKMPEFLEAVKAQARTSLAEEPLCYRFDVCRPQGENDAVFLYEVYRDNAAFEEHLKTSHFADFDRNAGGMIKNKSVRKMDKIWKKAHE